MTDNKISCWSAEFLLTGTDGIVIISVGGTTMWYNVHQLQKNKLKNSETGFPDPITGYH